MKLQLEGSCNGMIIRQVSDCVSICLSLCLVHLLKQALCLTWICFSHSSSKHLCTCKGGEGKDSVQDQKMRFPDEKIFVFGLHMEESFGSH